MREEKAKTVAAAAADDLFNAEKVRVDGQSIRVTLSAESLSNLVPNPCG